MAVRAQVSLNFEDMDLYASELQKTITNGTEDIEAVPNKLNNAVKKNKVAKPVQKISMSEVNDISVEEINSSIEQLREGSDLVTKSISNITSRVEAVFSKVAKHKELLAKWGSHHAPFDNASLVSAEELQGLIELRTLSSQIENRLDKILDSIIPMEGDVI